MEAPVASPSPPALRPPGPGLGRSLLRGGLRGDFCPTETRLFAAPASGPSPAAPAAGGPNSPGGAPSPPGPAAPGRTEPHRGEPDRAVRYRSGPSRAEKYRAAPSRNLPSRAERYRYRSGTEAERAARSRLPGSRGGAELGKVPLGLAPSRQEIPPRPGLIGKARRVVPAGQGRGCCHSP